ncbi:MAG: hypothetical protein B0W54_17110 [Cellvibrio sp. 79]|nr:MAG: hypothetical protein B0W54_17110 [Cellvibrio sp. 79]
MILRKIVLISAAFFSGMLATYYFAGKQRAAEEMPFISVSDFKNLQQRNQDLEKENQQLKNKLAFKTFGENRVVAQSNVESKREENIKSAPSSVPPQHINLQEYERAKKFSDWITQTIKNSGDISRDAAIGFLSEPIDTQWAGQQETSLRTTFSQYAGLGHFALKDVQCRTSLCQVSFAINSAQDIESITNETRNALETMSPHVAIISAPDTDKSVTHLYVSLEESGFAFIP